MINVGDLLTTYRVVNEASAELEKIRSDLSEVEKASQVTAYQLTLLGRGLREVGVIATAAFTAPFVGAVDSVVKFGGEFETQMTRIVTLAGASRQEVDSLTQSVLALGPTVGIGPDKLAEGLFVLESFGLRGAAAMDALVVAGRMSALGMGSVAETARGVTGALFAYREQNLSAAQAGDILTKTVQLGNMKISELVPALAKVNPVAAAMGVSFQDVAASIATFTHAGVDSSLAATGIRAVLNSILTDSAKTEKGFKALAEATGDNTISMANFRKEMADNGLTAAMIHLTDNVTKAGQAGISAFGSIIPNIRGLTEALAVYKTNGGLVVNILDQLNNSQGTLDKSTRELHKTWQFQWDAMKVEVQNLWIELSGQLLPIFKGVLDFVKNDFIPVVKLMVDTFVALPTSIQEAILIVGAFLAVIGPGAIIVGQFAMAIGNISRGLALLGGSAGTAALTANTVALEANTTATLGLAAAEVTASEGAVVWTASLAGLTFPFRLLVGQIEAFGLTTGISTTAVYLFETAMATLLGPIALITAGFAALILIVHELGFTWQDSILMVTAPSWALVAAWEGVKNSVAGNAVFKEIHDIFVQLKDIIINGFVVAVDSGKRAVNELWEVLKSNVPAEFGIGLKLLKIVIEDIETDITRTKTALVSWKDAIVNASSANREVALLLLALKVGYTDAKKSLDDLDSSLKNQADTVRGSISGAHNLVDVNTNLIAGFRGLIAPAQEAAISHQNLLDKVKALTEGQRDQIESLKAQGMSVGAIAKEMNIAADVVATYEKQVRLSSTGVAKANAEIASSYVALTAVQAKDVEEMLLLGNTHDNIAKKIGVTITQVNQFATALKANQKAADDLSKGVQDGQAKIAKYTQDSWNLVRDILSKKLEETNKLELANFEERLKAQKAFDEAVAQDSLTAQDFQKVKLQEVLDTAKGMLAAYGEEYRTTYELIVATVKIKLSEVEGVMKDHPMIDPNSIVKTKSDLQSLSTELGALGNEFTKLGPIAGGTFGAILSSIGPVLKAGQDLANLFKNMGNTNGTGQVGAGGGSSLGGGLTQAGVASLASTWLGVAIAIYAVANAIYEANKKADEAHKINLWASELQGIFKATTGFSDALNKSISATADSSAVMILVQDDLRKGGLLTADALIKMGKANNSADWLAAMQGIQNEIAEALHLADIIKELGGYSHLTADQVSLVRDRLKDLFLVIKAGGPLSIDAIKSLDDTISQMGQSSIDATGMVDQLFLDMVDQADKAGIHLKQVDDMLRGFLKDAADGLNQMMSGLQASADADAQKVAQSLGKIASPSFNADDAAIAAKKVQDLQKAYDALVKSGTASMVDLNAALAKLHEAQDVAAGLETDQEFKDRIAGITGQVKLTQEQFDGLSTAVAADFFDMVAKGATFKDALAAIQPSLNTLQSAMDSLGLNGTQSFQLLSDIGGIVNDKVMGPLADVIAGANKALLGLHNSGQLNQTMFTGIASTAVKAYNDIIAKGGDANAAMALMQPTLQTIWQLHKDGKLAVDAETQALLDQAEANGTIGEGMESIAQQQLDAIKKMSDAIVYVATVFGYLPKAADDAASGITESLSKIKVPDLKIKIGMDNDPTKGNGVVWDGPGFASEAYVRSPTLAMIAEQGAELVLKPSTIAAWLNAASLAGASAVTFDKAATNTNFGVPSNNTSISGALNQSPNASPAKTATGTSMNINKVYNVTITARNDDAAEKWRDWLREDGLEVITEEYEDGRFVSRTNQALRKGQ